MDQPASGAELDLFLESAKKESDKTTLAACSYGGMLGIPAYMTEYFKLYPMNDARLNTMMHSAIYFDRAELDMEFVPCRINRDFVFEGLLYVRAQSICLIIPGFERDYLHEYFRPRLRERAAEEHIQQSAV